MMNGVPAGMVSVFAVAKISPTVSCQLPRSITRPPFRRQSARHRWEGRGYVGRLGWYIVCSDVAGLLPESWV